MIVCSLNEWQDILDGFNMLWQRRKIDSYYDGFAIKDITDVQASSCFQIWHNCLDLVHDETTSFLWLFVPFLKSQTFLAWYQEFNAIKKLGVTFSFSQFNDNEEFYWLSILTIVYQFGSVFMWIFHAKFLGSASKANSKAFGSQSSMFSHKIPRLSFKGQSKTTLVNPLCFHAKFLGSASKANPKPLRSQSSMFSHKIPRFSFEGQSKTIRVSIQYVFTQNS